MRTPGAAQVRRRRLALVALAVVTTGSLTALGSAHPAAEASGRLLVSSAERGTWWLTPTGRRLTRVDRESYWHFRAAPGRSGVFLASTQGRLASGDVALFLLRGGRRTLVRGWSDSPAWAPDATRFAYVEQGTECLDSPTFSAKIRIRSLSIGASSDRPLLRKSPCVWDGHPSWARDGHRIAFDRSFSASRATARDGIHVIDLRTMRVRRITAGQNPEWSPDGRYLAITRGRALYTFELRSGSLVRLGSGLGIEYGLYRWSPDSRYLAYTVFGDEPNGISVIELRTAKHRQIGRGQFLHDWTR